MTKIELKSLLTCAKAWPDDAQAELLDVANRIECELRNRDYFAARDQLDILNTVMATVERGGIATDAEVAGYL